mmetsp:Transcript_7208/g.21090  ORF Transcript_7208/g.21090 Transcript_7208/m.21090 type:complete len:203 (+) Transcript_7208:1197-1805(+)
MLFSCTARSRAWPATVAPISPRPLKRFARISMRRTTPASSAVARLALLPASIAAPIAPAPRAMQFISSSAVSKTPLLHSSLAMMPPARRSTSTTAFPSAAKTWCSCRPQASAVVAVSSKSGAPSMGRRHLTPRRPPPSRRSQTRMLPSAAPVSTGRWGASSVGASSASTSAVCPASLSVATSIGPRRPGPGGLGLGWGSGSG